MSQNSNNEQNTDRAAALLVLGLKENANAYAIDNRFWQLTKRYRSEKNDEKLTEVTLAYEIASGRAAQKQQEETTEDLSKKVLGKSSRQWKVFFYYAWWKILAVIICLALGFSLVYQMVTGGNYDVKVVSIGHFFMDNTFVTKYSKSELGYKNPYITSADLIIDGSEAESNTTIYGAAAAATFLGTNPDVVIFDAKTMPYYITALNQLDSYYESLRETLPSALFDKITPVSCSMRQYKVLTAEEGDDTQFSPEDDISHIYGLEITDPELITALGYTNEWTSQKPSLVFSISSNSYDYTKAETFIESIMKNQSIIVQDYETENGPIKTAS